ncbi:hypothetical protein, partial [Thiolapillus sp.]
MKILKPQLAVLSWLLDVLSGISAEICASIAPNTGMRKKRGRQRDTTTGIGHIEKHQRDILEAFGVWLVEQQLT